MTDLELASYLDRGLSRTDRQRAESHFVECVECRQNLIGAQILLRHSRRPRKLAIVAGALAVAAGALLAVRTQLPAPAANIARDATPAAAVKSYGPAGSTSSIPVQFAWGAVPNAVAYHVTVSRPDGSTVWSAEVPDTVALLPPAILLEPRTDYVWFTDAFLSDGSTVSTGMTFFQVTVADSGR